ncbi:MAG: DUF4352 domain-containing protein [Anaerolineales bacterium]|nr:DUF4352 domain-containing protein [Anaerolineales bacterium]
MIKKFFKSQNTVRQWVQVKDYEVQIHNVKEQQYFINQDSKRIIFIEVEYRNQTQVENLSCRRNQWHLFTHDGYSYEALSEITSSKYYTDKTYFGGDRFINPGRNVRGWFAFEVPMDKQPEYIQFMNAFLSTKTADIEIANAIEIEEPKDISKSR